MFVWLAGTLGTGPFEQGGGADSGQPRARRGEVCGPAAGAPQAEVQLHSMSSAVVFSLCGVRVRHLHRTGDWGSPTSSSQRARRGSAIWRSWRRWTWRMWRLRCAAACSNCSLQTLVSSQRAKARSLLRCPQRLPAARPLASALRAAVRVVCAGLACFLPLSRSLVQKSCLCCVKKQSRCACAKPTSLLWSRRLHVRGNGVRRGPQRAARVCLGGG